MKRLNNIWVLLYLVLVLNFITWMGSGRADTLLLTTDGLNSGNSNCLDTVNVFMIDNLSPWYYSSVEEYSSETILRYQNVVQDLGFNLRLHPVSNTEGRNRLPKFVSPENCLYVFYIRKEIPLFTHISYVGLISGGTTYESYYIWFFRWWQIADVKTGF